MLILTMSEPITETSEGVNKTHTTWTFWYHNPVDKNWDLKSYTKIFEFSTLEDFWRIYHSWNECLPPISEGMFFLMRKLSNGNYIHPLWEDKYNRNGGFWSFKINKDDADPIWKELSIFLIAEKVARNLPDTMMINGISISPKRNFCIIKIWNNDTKKCDKALLNQTIPRILFSECMYKCHNDNIANDQSKAKRYQMSKSGGRTHNNGRKHHTRGTESY
jgi:hypothetical protein